MTNFEERQIVAGPSREELFDALKYRHEGRKVAFTVAPSHITGRNLAGGRKFVPGNLMFHARLEAISVHNLMDGTTWDFKICDEHESLGALYLEGTINTTTRQGRVQGYLNVPPANPRFHVHTTHRG